MTQPAHASSRLRCCGPSNIVLGVINAFDIPARQSFVVELVERREDLANAIALNR